jgi:4-amino-4-deoxy-L-arabinose transferase-like glycosyltransferase
MWRIDRRFALGLALCVVAGLAVRLVYIYGWKHPGVVGGDAYYYHHGANLLADGKGFVHPYLATSGKRLPTELRARYGRSHRTPPRRMVPAADHPPAYQTVLAAASVLGFRSFLAHQVSSALIGTLGVFLFGLAGRRVAGRRAGLIAAALVATGPNIFVHDAVVMSESLVVPATGFVILAGYRWWDLRRMRDAAIFGLAVGVAALTRAEALLVAPLVAVPLWVSELRRAGLRMATAALALAAITTVAAISPWVAYNLSRFERPVTLTTGAGAALLVANCKHLYYGDLVGYWSMDCIDGRRRGGVRRSSMPARTDKARRSRRASRAALLEAGTDASERDPLYRRRAKSYALKNIHRVPYVVSARIGRTFGLYNPKQQVHLDAIAEGKEIPLGWAGLLAWYATAGLAVAGAVGLRRRGRPVWPAAAYVVATAITSALFYGNTRFRLTAELAAILLAAAALDHALSRWRASRAARLGSA